MKPSVLEAPCYPHAPLLHHGRVHHGRVHHGRVHGRELSLEDGHDGVRFVHELASKNGRNSTTKKLGLEQTSSINADSPILN